MKTMRVKSLHKGKPLVSEHQIQAAYFDWVRLKAKTDWRYGIIYAIPNARKTYGAGRFHYWREGVVAGMPDVCIPIGKDDPPNENRWIHHWNAAYIEVKRNAKAKVSEKQKAMHSLLAQPGNCVTIATSLDEMIKFTEWYLGEI